MSIETLLEESRKVYTEFYSMVYTYLDKKHLLHEKSELDSEVVKKIEDLIDEQVDNVRIRMDRIGNTSEEYSQELQELINNHYSDKVEVHAENIIKEFLVRSEDSEEKEVLRNFVMGSI